MKARNRDIPTSDPEASAAFEKRIADNESLIAEVGNRVLKKLSEMQKALDADDLPAPTHHAPCTYVFDVTYDDDDKIKQIIATPRTN